MGGTFYDVIGIGRSFTDVIARVDDSFIEDHKLIKGVGIELPLDRLAALRNELPEVILSPGGIAGNTLAGLASLGAKTSLIAKVCDDEVGLSSQKVCLDRKIGFPLPLVAASKTESSPSCIIMVTPDGDRTMAYSKGVADRLSYQDDLAPYIKAAKIVFVQGHLLISPDCNQSFYQACQGIKRNKEQKLALSLNDLSLDVWQKAAFDHYLPLADIIIGNHREFEQLMGWKGPEDFIDGDTLMVMIDGLHGVYITGYGGYNYIPARKVAPVVDVTGACDQLAAGILFGQLHNLSFEKCGQLGLELASEIIRDLGGRPSRDWHDIASKYLRTVSIQFGTSDAENTSIA